MAYDGTTKWKVTLGQARALRFLFRFLFFACAFVAPTIVIGIKYNVFTKFSGSKISAIGILLLVTVAWAFRKKAMSWVNSWEYSIWKYIIIGFSKIWVFILLLAVLYASKNGIDTFIFCAEWLAIFEIVAYLVFDTLAERYDFIVKRLIRKNEHKEDLKEALAEIKEEGE